MFERRQHQRGEVAPQNGIPPASLRHSDTTCYRLGQVEPFAIDKQNIPSIGIQTVDLNSKKQVIAESLSEKSVRSGNMRQKRVIGGL